MAGKRSIQPGGSRGTLFEAAARARLEDAEILLEQNRFSGAIYLAGYAIECLLKWAVTQRREVIYLPAELEVHDWEILLTEAGLRPKLTAHKALDRSFEELAKIWGPELRYLVKPIKAEIAKELYGTLVGVYSWIQDNSL